MIIILQPTGCRLQTTKIQPGLNGPIKTP